MRRKEKSFETALAELECIVAPLASFVPKLIVSAAVKGRSTEVVRARESAERMVALLRAFEEAYPAR